MVERFQAKTRFNFSLIVVVPAPAETSISLCQPASVGGTVDVDFINNPLGTGAANVSYGPITSRSYHFGIAHVLLMDGAMRAASSQTDLGVWHELGTRAGGEMVGDF